MRVQLTFRAESAEEILWTLRDVREEIRERNIDVDDLRAGRSQDVWTERDGEEIVVGSLRVEEDDR